MGSFKVTRISEGPVKPASATPEETLPLAWVDRYPTHRGLVESMHIFRSGADAAPAVIRDALAKALTQQGADVIVLASGVTPAQVAAAASQEDVDAVVVGSYNGGALSLGRELRAGYDGLTIFGGILNEDTGGALPIDARPGLEALGITIADDAADVGRLIASR